MITAKIAAASFAVCPCRARWGTGLQPRAVARCRLARRAAVDNICAADATFAAPGFAWPEPAGPSAVVALSGDDKPFALRSAMTRWIARTSTHITGAVQHIAAHRDPNIMLAHA